MRFVTGAGALMIAAAVAISAWPEARADEANPFPSPSPTASTAPGAGGFAAVGVDTITVSGGTRPAPLPTGTPIPFHASGATGYSLELLGRLSPSYVATLRFEDANVHGADNPVVSRFDIAGLYEFGATHAAAGLGYASLQRSTASATSSGLGVGVALLPDFSKAVAPYGSLFLYPSLAGPANSHGSLTVLRAGFTLAPAKTGGLFARVGVNVQNFGAATFSPTAMSGLEFSVGATF